MIMKYRFAFLLFFAVSAVCVCRGDNSVPDRLSGLWDVYVIKNGEKNFLAGYCYEVKRGGRVEMISGGTGRRHYAGDFCTAGGQLMLLLHDGAQKADNAVHGIAVDFDGLNALNFLNSFSPGISLRLERRQDDNNLTAGWLRGSWSLIQQKTYSGEEKTAPFALVFASDGKYFFTGSNAERMNTEYAGSYEIKDRRIFLSGNCRDENSMWYNAVFFRDGSRLVLNRMDVFIRAEKI